MSCRRRGPGPHRDRGQVSPLVAVVVMGAAVAVLVIAHLGGVVVDRTRARNAADAAALAGATDGRSAAEEVARANGAVLEGWRQIDGATEVTVRVGRARATARARRGPPGGAGAEASPRLAA
jgi:uncharacterized membrane protein